MAHMAIRGNEAADVLSKRAAEEPEVPLDGHEKCKSGAGGVGGGGYQAVGKAEEEGKRGGGRRGGLSGGR